LLLAAAGLGLIVYLVHKAGPDRVASVFLQAGPWMPLILVLESLQILSDAVALRLILHRRAADVPAATWVRSSAVAYAMMILLPAGRAAGEVTRATLLAQHLGAATAATAGAQLQVSYLFAVVVASTIEWAVVATTFGAQTPLAWFLLANAVLMALTCGGLLALLWDARVGRWILRVQQRLLGARASSSSWDPGLRRGVPKRAALVCIAGRLTQTAQYGVILAAVGGARGVRSAFIAHGIHLVGATLGDLVPNQLGIVDGTYSAFAGALGLGDKAASAISIAFVAHAVQLTMAAACVLVAAVIRHEGRSESRVSGAGRSSVRAGARS
jgi:hypothetical protein